MKIQELKERLSEKGVSEFAYSFFGDGIGECYVLSKEENRWLVYYSERGHRNGLRGFDTEEEACQHLLNTVLADPATRGL
jgi:hypothetical protein